MHRSSWLLFFALALAACSSSTAPSATDAGADACAPLPCPSNAPWDPAQCKCVQSASSTLHASDYDQSCTTAADCVAMAEGNLCPCACSNAAIAKKDEAKEEADAQRARAQCVPVECGACAQSRTHCIAGKCALEVCDATGACPPEASDAGTD